MLEHYTPHARIKVVTCESEGDEESDKDHIEEEEHQRKYIHRVCVVTIWERSKEDANGAGSCSRDVCKLTMDKTRLCVRWKETISPDQ
jgi:hypothetical protein